MPPNQPVSSFGFPMRPVQDNALDTDGANRNLAAFSWANTNTMTNDSVTYPESINGGDGDPRGSKGYLLSSARGMLSSGAVNNKIREKLRAAGAVVSQAAAPISSMWFQQSRLASTIANEPSPGATRGHGSASQMCAQTPGIARNTAYTAHDVFEEVSAPSAGSTQSQASPMGEAASASYSLGRSAAPVDLLDAATLRALNTPASRAGRERLESGSLISTLVQDEMEQRMDRDDGAMPLELDVFAKKAESEENLKRSSLGNLSINASGGALPCVQLPHSWTPGSKPVLVLDLDETLIHSSLIPKRAPDFTIDVVQNFDDRTRETFFVYKRPLVDQFLAHVAKQYHVIVFTAGIREYASQILNRLDPTGELVCGRLYRDACTEVRTGGTTYAKDMRKCVVPASLSKVLLVDNTPGCFAIHPANGLLIKSWYTDPADRQLARLAEFLTAIKGVDDLRNVVREWNPNC